MIDFHAGDRVRVDGRKGTVRFVQPVAEVCDVEYDDEYRTNRDGTPFRHGVIFIDIQPLSAVEVLAELSR